MLQYELSTYYDFHSHNGFHFLSVTDAHSCPQGLSRPPYTYSFLIHKKCSHFPYVRILDLLFLLAFSSSSRFTHFLLNKSSAFLAFADAGKTRYNLHAATRREPPDDAYTPTRSLTGFSTTYQIRDTSGKSQRCERKTENQRPGEFAFFFFQWHVFIFHILTYACISTK